MSTQKDTTGGASDQATLIGGPFNGIKVPRPAWKWDRISIPDAKNDKVARVYRPVGDGAYYYWGRSQVLALPDGPDVTQAGPAGAAHHKTQPVDQPS